MIAALPLLFCASLSAFAQGLGEVSVSVHDQSGAALPGVRVTIHARAIASGSRLRGFSCSASRFRSRD